MIEWIKSNFTWLFDGLAIWIIGIIGTVIGIFIKWFHKNYKVIKRKDYVDIKILKKQLQQFVDADCVFKDLQFDKNDGVFYKIDPDGSKEFYCPICKDANKKLIHLEKDSRAVGNLYRCKNCKNSFGKGYYPIEKNPYEDFINWNG